MFSILLIEYFVYKVSLAQFLPLLSYTASWVPIIMYCLGLYLVINGYFNYVQIFKYVQSLRNIDMYLIQNFVILCFTVFD